MGNNEILYWLSANRAGSWAQFRSAVEDLVPRGDEAVAGPDRPYLRIRFNIQQLGHVEFFEHGCENGWRVAPPVLALSEQSNGVVGILCGARLPNLIRKIEEVADSVRREQHTGAEHPDVFRLVGDHASDLEDVAQRAGVLFQPYAPLSILSCLPRVLDLKAWNSNESPLPFGRDTNITRFELTKRSCRWVESSVEDAKRARDGLFRVTRFQRREHYLRLNGRTFRVRSQVGNYFVAAVRRRQLLRYDRTACQLIVPDVCRPPMLVDRALILCSGFLPRHDKETSTLTYSDIPEGIAGKAASILCQDRL